MTPLKIVEGNYPHTAVLKNGEVPVEDVDCVFPRNAPSDPGFAYTVHDLTNDASEMALVTFLQAREAGHQLTLLPVVMAGNFHHRSLKSWPSETPITPHDLKGKKVGIRTYSQTTGLWVRGLLKEDYALESGDVTWVTNEGAFVKEYSEPPYVERTDTTLASLLRSGEIVAALALGAAAKAEHAYLKEAGVELISVVPDPAAAEKAWFERHRTIPINHMLVVQSELLASQPDAVQALYEAFERAITDTASERGDAPKEKVVSFGFNDSLMRGVELAIKYGLEQELLHEEISVEQLFADSSTYIRKH